jgi:hypothetical protein
MTAWMAVGSAMARNLEVGDIVRSRTMMGRGMTGRTRAKRGRGGGGL